MAEENAVQSEILDPKEEKKRIKEEKKQLKQEQKEQRKEARAKAKEIARQEDEINGDESNPFITILVTVFIVLIWLGIIGLLIKLDVGGFGSTILQPVLQDVPVLNMILPGDSIPNDGNAVGEGSSSEEYGGYKSLREAVEQIRVLELELEQAQNANSSYEADIDTLRAEIRRLQTFEDNQIEFERIKNEFYEEVVYAENGPGAEAYQKYFESMDPSTAEYLYKEVVREEEASSVVKDYAQAYSEMKPKEAAAIFEAMTDNLDLAAKILETMSADDRGAILGAMDPEVASRLTKIMDPE